MHKLLFIIICGMFFLALGAGLGKGVEFKRGKKADWKTFIIYGSILSSISFLIPFVLYYVLGLLPNSDYWYTIAYTICFALMTKDAFYKSVKEEPTTFYESFQIGFTENICSRYILCPPTRSTIHLFYLALLIAGQLLDMNMIRLPEDIERFVLLNKYGLIIIYAIDKIFVDLPKEKRMLNITNEAENAFNQKQKDDMKELTNDFKEFIKILVLAKRKNENDVIKKMKHNLMFCKVKV